MQRAGMHVVLLSFPLPSHPWHPLFSLTSCTMSREPEHPPPWLLQGSVPGGTGARAMCSRYLAAHDAAARLRASMREEHMLGLDLASTIYKHVSRSYSLVRGGAGLGYASSGAGSGAGSRADRQAVGLGQSRAIEGAAARGPAECTAPALAKAAAA